MEDLSVEVQKATDDLLQVCIMNSLPMPSYTVRLGSNQSYICEVSTNGMFAAGVDMKAEKSLQRAANNLIIVLDDIYQYPNNRQKSSAEPPCLAQRPDKPNKSALQSRNVASLKGKPYGDPIKTLRGICTRKHWPQPEFIILQKPQISAINQFVAQCKIENLCHFGMGATHNDACFSCAAGILDSFDVDDNYQAKVLNLDLVSDDVIEKPKIMQLLQIHNISYVAYPIASKEAYKQCVLVELSLQKKKQFIGPLEGINNVFQQILIVFNMLGLFAAQDMNDDSSSDEESFERNDVFGLIGNP